MELKTHWGRDVICVSPLLWDTGLGCPHLPSERRHPVLVEGDERRRPV